MEAKIHVSIASFRDNLCSRTLHRLFSKAQNPRRLVVRVLQQNDPDDESDIGCVEGWCDQFGCEDWMKELVIVKAIHAKDAKGKKRGVYI